MNLNVMAHPSDLGCSVKEHKNLKITMCAPEWFHLRHGQYAYPKDVYKNDGERFSPRGPFAFCLSCHFQRSILQTLRSRTVKRSKNYTQQDAVSCRYDQALSRS